MKLVIGLGNPGEKYKHTRHNAGFVVLRALASQQEPPPVWNNNTRHNALVARITLNNTKVLLVEPQTYMNLSGISVQGIARYYRIAPQDVLVVYDDLSIPFGQIKYKARGGTAGHNGLKSLEKQLNSQEYARLKIGINGGPEARKYISGADYVLGKWTKTEQKELPQIIKQAITSIYNWIGV